jgi:hypothetical protein
MTESCRSGNRRECNPGRMPRVARAFFSCRRAIPAGDTDHLVSVTVPCITAACPGKEQKNT